MLALPQAAKTQHGPKMQSVKIKRSAIFLSIYLAINQIQMTKHKIQNKHKSQIPNDKTSIIAFNDRGKYSCQL
jgi:hypothetical protein